MSTKKQPGKSIKQDRKLVSNQAHELAYMKEKWGVSRRTVQAAKKEVGRSRVKIIAWLILHDLIEDIYLVRFEKIVA